jgi:hypothetical protein
MKWARIAATCLFAFHVGCATTQLPNFSVAGVGGESAYLYCYESRHYRASGDHVCNWGAVIAEVCDGRNATSRLSSSSVKQEFRKFRMCANGQWLLAVEAVSSPSVSK